MANLSYYFMLFMVVIIVFLFISFISSKRHGTHHCASCLVPGIMILNLYEKCSFHSTLFVVFLRFHTLEIGCLAVDERLDDGPVDGQPLHTVGIGDDEVET